MQGILGAGLLGRLYWLQVESNDHYKMLSDKNRLHNEFLLPIRGQIFDTHGQLLAGNQFIHRAFLQRDGTEGWQKSLDRFAELLNLSTGEVESPLKTAKYKNKFLPLCIKDPLTWEEVATIELHNQELPGIHVEQGQCRFYPHAKIFCHILGYVGQPSIKDKEELLSHPVAQHPGFRMGKAGVEKMFEKILQGTPGIKQVEVNATRQIVRNLSISPPHNGEDLTLSLKLDLQKSIYDRLSLFESASAVVMDVRSGGLLACVSTPSFDTNHFMNGIPRHLWEDLRSNPHSPLVAKFAQGQYAPGSVFKMIVALAGLKSGVVDEHTTFFCPGYYDLVGKGGHMHRFHCHLKGGHGHVNLQQALAKSCDVYFYHLSLLCGVEAIAQMSALFGLGTPTTLGFPGEKAGLIPSKNWKEQLRGKKWTPAETINTSIGQGYVLTTPLQLCVMTARLASKGRAVQPFLIQNQRVFESLDIDIKHMDLVFQGMRDVMSDVSGTAYASRSPLPHIEFAGKTGTAQVRRITKQDRELGLHKKWPWHWRDHALFVGFAPVHDPEYAVSVVIEHGGSGGKVAAPLGRDILVDTFKYISA